MEDNNANRLLLRQLLKPLGFEVRESMNGEEALELMKEWRPDLILMDVRMPVMNGFEATKMIRTMPLEQQPIIIAVTASAFEHTREEIMLAGFDDYISKPFRIPEMLERIERFLNIEFIYEKKIYAGNGCSEAA